MADRVVYLSSDLREADRNIPADYRETIMVHSTHEADRVAALLPVLLPQLGIPVDAVGILAQWSPLPPISMVIAGTEADSATGSR